MSECGFSPDQRFIGQVTVFDAKKGHGFIRPLVDGMPDIFVGYASISDAGSGFKTLIPYSHVSFGIRTNDRGLCAFDVHTIKNLEQLIAICIEHGFITPK